MTIYSKPRAELFAQDAPPSEIKPFTAWLRGLGIAFDETNGYPEMESFNGLLQALNGYIKYLEQNGFAEWSSTLEYPIGAGVRVGAVWYRAKAQNLNKPPATSQNEWTVFLNASDLSFSDPLQVVDGVIGIKDASTTQKGVARFATAAEVSNKTNVSAMVNPSNAATIAQSTDLGVGQYWQNVTGSRASGVTYTNNTGKPIKVSVGAGGRDARVLIYVNDVLVAYSRDTYDGDQCRASASEIVPNGASYKVEAINNFSVNVQFWAELR